MKKSSDRIFPKKTLHAQQRMKSPIMPQPSRMRKPTRAHKHRTDKSHQRLLWWYGIG
ncbi:MAG: hypothetical protein NTZ94_15775 [Verrucomicrobia bacterium]|nr:hypothetical protein [Verrucomicrobiota bacterium]